jgi:hypothetical protein
VNPDIGIVLRGMDARALLGASGGEFDIQLHDKLAALTVLIKRLGGLPDERPVEVNTQVNVIAGEQPGAILGNIALGRVEVAHHGPGDVPQSDRLRTWC